jgi:hypothetical protein
MKRLRWYLVVAPLLVVLLAAGAVAQQREAPERVVTQQELRSTIATQEQYHSALTLLRNVIGTGVSADASGRGVIKVYASSSAVRGVPTQLDGVPVIVEVTGPFVAFQGQGNGNGNGKGGGGGPPFDRTARYRPAPIGVSTGHPDITAGTIGARVTDGVNVYALSNNHVYANLNAANIGDNVLQPGAFDGGVDPGDAFATLWNFGVLGFSVLEVNVIDAAIALSSPSELSNATPPDGYGVPRVETIPAAVGLRVMKYGRTTGLTKARVSDINVFTIVQYGPDFFLWFDQQILISGVNFSAGGDSGSLVVGAQGADARKPVGLLFAGGFNSTLANPIDAVLAEFGVWIDGE